MSTLFQKECSGVKKEANSIEVMTGIHSPLLPDAPVRVWRSLDSVPGQVLYVTSLFRFRIPAGTERSRPQDRDPPTGPTCLVSPNDLASGLIIHMLRLTIGGDGFDCKVGVPI